MADFLNISKAVVGRLQANYSGLPILINNDDADELSLQAGFIYVSTVVGDSRTASINAYNARFRTTGLIEISIMSPVNEGENAALTLADTLAAIFRGKSFSNMVCFAPFIDRGQKVEYNKGNFWRVDLFCPFKYESHYSIT